jgi:plasmid maintenance system antidote protein VapI
MGERGSCIGGRTTALWLGRLFGTTAEFWVNLQTRYDLEVARDQQEKNVEREAQRWRALDESKAHAG